MQAHANARQQKCENSLQKAKSLSWSSRQTYRRKKKTGTKCELIAHCSTIPELNTTSRTTTCFSGVAADRPFFFPSQQLLFTRQFVTSPSSCQRSSLRPPWKTIRGDHFQKFSILFVLFITRPSLCYDFMPWTLPKLQTKRYEWGGSSGGFTIFDSTAAGWLSEMTVHQRLHKVFSFLANNRVWKSWCVSDFGLGDPLAVSDLLLVC